MILCETFIFCSPPIQAPGCGPLLGSFGLLKAHCNTPELGRYIEGDNCFQSFLILMDLYFLVIYDLRKYSLFTSTKMGTINYILNCILKLKKIDFI